MRKSAMDRWASIATSNVKPNQAAPDVLRVHTISSMNTPQRTTILLTLLWKIGKY